VSNGVRIGTGCRIGAASLVSVDLADGVSAVGNPLRILKDRLELK
jgi:acetyltransferase-like isoleucine patch superfamily enzyme